MGGEPYVSLRKPSNYEYMGVTRSNQWGNGGVNQEEEEDDVMPT